MNRISTLLRGRGRGAVPALLLLVVIAVCACSCGPRPPVTTSTGAVVPAATVEAQDAVADILKLLKDAQADLVAQYEREKESLTASERKARYEQLTMQADALDSSWAALIAWKRQSGGAAPADILRPVVAQAPAFLRLAVAAKVLTQKQADFVSGFLSREVRP